MCNILTRKQSCEHAVYFCHMLIVNSVILIVALIKTTQAAVVTRNIMRVTYECCKIVLSSGNFLGYYFCLL